MNSDLKDINIQNGYKVYCVNDTNWYASKLDYKSTLEEILSYESMLFSLDELDVYECDLDNDGMYYPIRKANDEDKYVYENNKNYIIFEGYLEEWITLREALKRVERDNKEWDYGDIFLLSTSDR